VILNAAALEAWDADIPQIPQAICRVKVVEEREAAVAH
jgi:hypothetical protein